MAIAKDEFKPVNIGIKHMAEELKAIKKRLDSIHAPYTPGRLIDWRQRAGPAAGPDPADGP